MGYIEAGRAEGATLLTGGRRPPRLASGYFIEPTGELGGGLPGSSCALCRW